MRARLTRHGHRQLTGISIANERDAIRACDALHDMGVGVVVITSVEFAGDDAIVVIASARRTAAPPDVAGDVAAATPPVSACAPVLHALVPGASCQA